MRWLMLLGVPLGLALGIAAGLMAAWGPLAGGIAGAQPAELRRTHKEEYLRLVASAFAEERDLRAARSRLDALGAGSAPLWISELAQADAAADQPTSARRLAQLAVALAITDPAIVAIAATPTPGTPPGSWRLLDQETLSCAQRPSAAPTLIVRLVDGAGQPLPNADLTLLDGTGTPLALRTDPLGEATTALVGTLTLPLPDHSPVPLSDAGLAADCLGQPDAPHALRVTVQITP